MDLLKVNETLIVCLNQHMDLRHSGSLQLSDVLFFISAHIFWLLCSPVSPAPSSHWSAAEETAPYSPPSQSPGKHVDHLC